MVFTVYDMTFLRKNAKVLNHYAGMTSMSVAGRRANHEGLPVDWAQNMRPETLHLRIHKTCKTKATALAEEARLAATLMHDDEDHARGGPWSLPRIMPRHRAEIAMVFSCCSASQVISQAIEGSALWNHLHDESYGGRGSGGEGGGWTNRSTKKTTAKKKNSKTIKKLSGSERLKRAGLKYGSTAYDAARYGKTPKKTQAQIQAKYNAMRPGRNSGH
jgi:hypothetical protein